MELGITFFIFLTTGLILGTAPWFKNQTHKMIVVSIGVVVASIAVTVNPIPETALMLVIHLGAIVVPVIICGIIRQIPRQSLFLTV